MPKTLFDANKRQVSTRFLHLVFLFIIVTAVYSNCTKNGFVWDDRIFLIGNNVYKNFEIPHILFARANGVEYLPVRDLTYAVDYALWGENPFGFHVTNLSIFLLTLFVLYHLSSELIEYLGQPVPSSNSALIRHTPLLITLLFALHPVQAQAVNFIACRNVLVSGLFFFLSLHAYLRYLQHTNTSSRWTYYALSLLCFFLALLSKATVIILPLVLILLALHSGRAGKALVKGIPFFLLSALFFVQFRGIAVAEKVIRQDSYDFGSLNSWITAAKTIQIPFFYLYKVLVPSNFSAEYEINFIKSISHPEVIIFAGLLLTASWLAWKFRDRNRILLFGLCWYLTTLLPVMNFYPTNPVVADRYLYLPFFGIALATVGSIERLFAKNNRLALAGAGVILLLLSLITRSQNSVWESDITLWQHTVKISPHVSKSYANLGYVYLGSWQYETAYGYFKKAQELDPSKPDFEYVRGATAYNHGEYQAAIGWFQKALFRKPGYMPALFYLGMSYDKTGDPRSAMTALKATFYSPEPDLKNYRARSMHYLRSVLWPQVEPELQTLRNERVQKNSPDVTAKLADVLFRYGRYDEALALYQDLDKEGYRSLETWRNQGDMYLLVGKLPEARNCFLKGLEIDNADSATLNGLGIVYKKMKQYRPAESAFKAAIGRQPSNVAALSNLAVLYFELGDKTSALNCFGELEKIAPASFNSLPYLRKISSAVL